MSASRDAYLEALGVTRWVSRSAPADASGETPARRETAPAPEPDMGTAPGGSAVAPTADRLGIVLGPGTGSCLFICGAGEDLSGPLASDLARILPDPPVWAQVADDGGGAALEAVIAEHLFTQVVVFGEAQARAVFAGDLPERVGPARLTVTPGLSRIAADAGARRRCWFALRSSGCVAAR